MFSMDSDCGAYWQGTNIDAVFLNIIEYRYSGRSVITWNCRKWNPTVHFVKNFTVNSPILKLLQVFDFINPRCRWLRWRWYIRWNKFRNNVWFNNFAKH